MDDLKNVVGINIGNNAMQQARANHNIDGTIKRVLTSEGVKKVES